MQLVIAQPGSASSDVLRDSDCLADGQRNRFGPEQGRIYRPAPGEETAALRYALLQFPFGPGIRRLALFTGF